MKKLRDFVSMILSPLKVIYGWIIFHIYWFLPLENKVVFSCFSGKRYGDSPKYISMMLHEKHPEIKQVWIYDKKKLVGLPKYIRQVKRHSREMMKELATSKVWVDSHYQPCWVFKRKNGQFFLETWHGGLGFKKIGFETKEKIPMVELARLRHTSKAVDLWLSNSDWLSNAFRNGNRYEGEILKIGLPKMAFLIKNEKDSRKKVREFYGLNEDSKLVVYAPTMRKNPKETDFDIDVKSVLGALEEKMGGDFKMAIRLHPVNEAECKNIEFGGDVLKGNAYSDMQELIAAADVFISDYSSAMFDSAILRHPTFCFAFDEDEYEKERGFCVKLKDLPFPIARNNEELIREIEEFDKKEYEKKLDQYFEKVGLNEQKDSTEKVVAIIMERMDE
ncbi:CDP-glycerol glycerophosphotransferase family protein [Candidatus Saccharibacteria bacterium]|nr:CDP-glycerol glycerophosphotransferase family protein [Candidatus Saccharibacteria bacterium]